MNMYFILWFIIQYNTLFNLLLKLFQLFSLGIPLIVFCVSLLYPHHCVYVLQTFSELLALQDAPGSSGIYPVLDVDSAISLWIVFPFSK